MRFLPPIKAVFSVSVPQRTFASDKRCSQGGKTWSSYFVLCDELHFHKTRQKMGADWTCWRGSRHPCRSTTRSGQADTVRRLLRQALLEGDEVDAGHGRVPRRWWLRPIGRNTNPTDRICRPVRARSSVATEFDGTDPRGMEARSVSGLLGGYPGCGVQEFCSAAANPMKPAACRVRKSGAILPPIKAVFSVSVPQRTFASDKRCSQGGKTWSSYFVLCDELHFHKTRQKMGADWTCWRGSRHPCRSTTRSGQADTVRGREGCPSARDRAPGRWHIRSSCKKL